MVFDELFWVGWVVAGSAISAAVTWYLKDRIRSDKSIKDDFKELQRRVASNTERISRLEGHMQGYGFRALEDVDRRRNNDKP